MSTTRYLLLAGLVVVIAAVWKINACNSSPIGDVKVTGRDDGSEQIVEISRGEPVELGDHIVGSGRTLFELGAQWCPGCRMLAPQLEAVVEQTPELFLRKIDIAQWGSPVAQQFAVKSIPYLVLYDRRGKLLAAGTREVLEKLQSR